MGPVARRSVAVTGGSLKQTDSPLLVRLRSVWSRPRGRGQTLVEFTLILPVLLLLTVGIIDAARLFAADISLTNGVREAALLAGTGSYNKPSDLRTAIEAEASGMDLTKLVIEDVVCDPSPCGPSSDKATITARYPFQPIMPLVDQIMGSVLPPPNDDLGRAVWITASTTALIQK